MQAVNLNNPSDRKKLILLAVLALVAIILIWWTFIGFGSSSTPARPTAQVSPAPTPRQPTNVRQNAPVEVELAADDLYKLQPISENFWPVGAPPPKRNIFVYYEPPPVVPKASIIPTPTPTPVPPVLLASISPPNVYARTADFTMEVTGDKFSPQLHIVIDNNDLPTRYINGQQLSATVPASYIATPGTRQIMLRSSDGKLYSNTLLLSIADPPKPNYSYIGIIGTPRHIDTAILLDKNNKDTLNVQRGDLVGGRFRITSISEREVVLIDNSLKIKHTLAMTSQGERGNPLQRPTPRVDSEDDEP